MVKHTLREPDNLPKRIAHLRRDTGFYETTKVELEVLYPMLVSGGILMIGYYGHWKGRAQDDG